MLIKELDLAKEPMVIYEKDVYRLFLNLPYTKEEFCDLYGLPMSLLSKEKERSTKIVPGRLKGKVLSAAIRQEELNKKQIRT